MKIGIIGGTSLGKTLGIKYLNAGLKVVFGVRSEFDTEQAEWKVLNRFYDKLCPYSSAIIQSDIVLICCDNQQFDEVCDTLSKTDLESKIIIDCTNSPYNDQLQNQNTAALLNSCKDAKIFKAFNNLGLDYPSSDKLGVVKETFYCGEDSPEKNRVKRLIEFIGFKAIDAGALTNSTLLEAFYHLRKEISFHQQAETNCHFKLISV